MDINKLSAEELLRESYGKQLNTKKNILEYIELSKILKNEEVLEEKVQETYNLIYNSIENLEVKPNTKMYLKNDLKSMLGKKVKNKDPKEENKFIKFFKKAYPKGERRKDFTWVLMDINKITDEQIWTTLTYINKEIINRTTIIKRDDKEEIIKMIQKVADRKNIKYINSIRSLEKLVSLLKIKILEKDGKFKVVRYEDNQKNIGGKYDN